MSYTGNTVNDSRPLSPEKSLDDSRPMFFENFVEDSRPLSPETSEHDSRSLSPERYNSASSTSIRSVESRGSVPIETQLEKKLELGSILESLDQVYVLYCEYARCVGFSVKKGTQGYFTVNKGRGRTCEDESEIRMKVYHCSCEGFPDKKRSINKIPKYKKQVMRTDCKARLRVVRKRGGPWVVSVFYKAHNHDLLKPEQSYLLRSARNLSIANKSIVESLNAAGIGISRICRFMEKEAGGPENVGFLRKDVYAHMSKLKKATRIDNGDATALLKHFIEKSNTEQNFHWKVDVDDDGRLMNLFIRDAQCAVDYEYFGDVLSLDTTFKTNRYNLHCAPFVGLNHHGHNVMFAIGFLSDETTESFEWLLEAFLESMDRIEPKVIFTDQSQALINAVDFSFRTAKHRLCQWHINENTPRHFGKLNGDKKFKQLWYRLMNKCDTEEEWEQLWTETMTTYNLLGNKWFSSMYNLRRRWADVFTNHFFSAGLHATSRSEATNKVIKDLCSSSTSLYEFVQEYERLQNEWRRRESVDDANCRGMPGQVVEKNPLLTHAASLFTRHVYQMYEVAAVNSINVFVVKYPNEDDTHSDELTFEVSSTVEVGRTRYVVFNKNTNAIKCSCHEWDVKGVMCSHMFRILYLLDVREIPDCLILRRWTRDAKLRQKYCGTGLNSNSSRNHISGMRFVNNLMRNAFSIGQKFMADYESRTIIEDWMDGLADELVRNIKRRNRKRQRKENGTEGSQNPEPFLDPPIPTHRTYPAKRFRQQDSHSRPPKGKRNPGRTRKGKKTGKKTGDPFNNLSSLDLGAVDGDTNFGNED